MTQSGASSASEQRSRLVSSWIKLLRSGLDPEVTPPQLLRQVRVLNGLMLTAMALCVPLGLFWTHIVAPVFGYVYLGAFVTWATLFCWLQRSFRVTLIGRAAVFVLFGLCTASVLLLGGTNSNLLAWYMLMPLAAAVCVGRRDLWFWCVISTVTPMLIFLFPDSRFISSSPFSPELNHQLGGVVLALGALIVSILTSIWISHHERLAQRLDDSVARLKKEAEAHRLLVDTAMLASGEVELNAGAVKLLHQIEQVDWVAAVGFWNIVDGVVPQNTHYQLPTVTCLQPTQALADSVQRGERTFVSGAEANHHRVYHPVRDGKNTVGVIEVVVAGSAELVRDSGWFLHEMAIQLGHIAERERTASVIAREARYDSLTGLHNRRAFHDNLENEISLAQQHQRKVALLFIDLNDFKRVNDSLGHAAGDSVLQVVAERLQQAVRHTDSPATQPARALDSIARVGGDEFTLMLEGIQLAEDADRAAQRILDSLAAPIQLHGQQFRVGASIGIALYPDDAHRADVLIRSADAAMYAAKRRGRSGYSRYSDADKAVDSLGFEAEIRRAIENGQLEMHYQPVFSCNSGAPIGAEALIRWRHPERGWISPAEFIPLAESLGLIVEIGQFQFDTVLSWFEAAGERGELPEEFRIALNLSPMQIEDPNFVAWLLDRLNDSPLHLRNIELEITETALLADTPITQANVRALADLGLCITLDDFGTGQSSLSLLKRFPIGRIKIDRSFVNGLPDRSEDVAIVGAVLSLAQSLGIPVVAEGVENTAQKDFLTQRRCDDMQGFLLAKPMSGAHLAEILEQLMSMPTETASTRETAAAI